MSMQGYGSIYVIDAKRQQMVASRGLSSKNTASFSYEEALSDAQQEYNYDGSGKQEQGRSQALGNKVVQNSLSLIGSSSQPQSSQDLLKELGLMSQSIFPSVHIGETPQAFTQIIGGNRATNEQNSQPTKRYDVVYNQIKERLNERLATINKALVMEKNRQEIAGIKHNGYLATYLYNSKVVAEHDLKLIEKYKEKGDSLSDDFAKVNWEKELQSLWSNNLDKTIEELQKKDILYETKIKVNLSLQDAPVESTTPSQQSETPAVLPTNPTTDSTAHPDTFTDIPTTPSSEQEDQPATLTNNPEINEKHIPLKEEPTPQPEQNKSETSITSLTPELSQEETPEISVTTETKIEPEPTPNKKLGKVIEVTKNNAKVFEEGWEGKEVEHSSHGDDIINVNGYNAWVRSDDGDDTINVNGKGADLYGDNGNDTITVYGDKAYVAGGSGDDTITVNGNNARADGGDGKDIIEVNGDDAYVSAGYGGGGDTITVNGDRATVWGEMYSNSNITVNGNDATINGAHGKDTITVNGDYAWINAGYGGDSDTIIVNGNGATIDGGDGDDTIILNGVANLIKRFYSGAKISFSLTLGKLIIENDNDDIVVKTDDGKTEVVRFIPNSWTDPVDKLDKIQAIVDAHNVAIDEENQTNPTLSVDTNSDLPTNIVIPPIAPIEDKPDDDGRKIVVKDKTAPDKPATKKALNIPEDEQLYNFSSNTKSISYTTTGNMNITNINTSPVKDGKITVDMDIFNKSSTPGILEILDENNNVVDYVLLEENKFMATSALDMAKYVSHKIVDNFIDGFQQITGKVDVTYDNESAANVTKIRGLEIPAGTHIRITNSTNQSEELKTYYAASLCYDSLVKAIKIAKVDEAEDLAGDELSKAGKLAMVEIVKDYLSEYSKEFGEKIIEKPLEEVIENLSVKIKKDPEKIWNNLLDSLKNLPTIAMKTTLEAAVNVAAKIATKMVNPVLEEAVGAAFDVADYINGMKSVADEIEYRDAKPIHYYFHI